MRGTSQGELFEVRHESSNDRGFWLPCEPRQGVTDEDPKRYRRFTLEQLQERGEAAGGYTTQNEHVIADIDNQIRQAIAGNYEDQAPVRTRHTLLGRKREQKQAAYYQMRESLAQEAEAAGLSDADVDDLIDAWDDLEDYRSVKIGEGSNAEYAIYGPDNEPIAGFKLHDLYRRQAKTSAEIEEVEAWIEQQNAIEEGMQYVQESGFELADLGIDQDDLLGDLDLLRDLIDDRAFNLRVELDELESVDLDDFPF